MSYVVTKILEGTLTAGQTSITFTDTEIPNSLLRIFSNDDSLMYLTATISSNTLTVTYEAQASNKYIAVEIIKSGLTIVDDLTSTDTDKPLSAKQGKILKDAIDSIIIPEVPEKITDLDDVNVTSISNGQVLAWDSITSKFVNVNQSGTSSINYSKTEHQVGTWIDDSPVYEKTIEGTTITGATTYSVAHDISNFNILIDANIVCKSSDNSFWRVLNFAYNNGTTNNNWLGGFAINSTNILFQIGSSFSEYISEWYATIRYTKTS